VSQMSVKWVTMKNNLSLVTHSLSTTDGNDRARNLK